MQPIAGTNCYLDPQQHQSAALVDFSFTALTSKRQQKDLATALVKAYDAMPANGKLSVFTTARSSAGGDIAVPDFTICRPAETREEQRLVAGYADSLQVISRQIAESRKKFEQHVAHIVKLFQDESKAALDSPILESIQSNSRQYEQSGLEHLMVYSDGIQNSDVLQFCLSKGHLPPFQRFVQLAQYDVIKPANFTGTQVDMLLVESFRLPTGSYKHYTNAELRAFYPAYFEGHGASVQLTRVRYGGTPQPSNG